MVHISIAVGHAESAVSQPFDIIGLIDKLMDVDATVRREVDILKEGFILQDVNLPLNTGRQASAVIGYDLAFVTS